MLGYLARNGTGAEEAELAEALELTAGVVRYHLSILRSADLIAHVGNREQGSTDRYVATASGAALRPSA